MLIESQMILPKARKVLALSWDLIELPTERCRRTARLLSDGPVLSQSRRSSFRIEAADDPHSALRDLVPRVAHGRAKATMGSAMLMHS